MQPRLRQQDVADRLGVHHVDVSRWERDEHLPQSGRLVELANLFQVPVGWLLQGTGPMPFNNNVSRGTISEPGATYGDPITTPQQAARRVRALGKRLEADLEEWGAGEADFSAAHQVLATDDTVRMFAEGFADRLEHIPEVVATYERMVDSLRAALKDRIEAVRRFNDPDSRVRHVNPAIVQPAPVSQKGKGRGSAGS